VKVLYFDCFAGASGDMILGALVDAGLPLDNLKSELAKLGLSGYTISATKVVKHGITGTKISIETEEQHIHRHLKHIEQIIGGSNLSEDIKDTSIRVFENLAAAEARIHNTGVEKIHFHEVGALDAIVDIVGSLIGMKLLGVDAVYSSKIPIGTGFVECEHGNIPVPAPATLELLKGVPLVSTGIEAELTTPTGAAILTTVSQQFGTMPQMRLEKIGYGAGSRDLEIPNLLRLLIGEPCASGYECDQVELIESNIDDMNPEFFDHVFDRLLDSGALDVYITPVSMKKNRPGVVLGVLAPPDKRDSILSTIFDETTTFGVRIQPVERRKLAREERSVKTRFGYMKVKIGKHAGKVKIVAPEYEDCKKVAAMEGLPLKDVYDEVKAVAQDL